MRSIIRTNRQSAVSPIPRLGHAGLRGYKNSEASLELSGWAAPLNAVSMDLNLPDRSPVANSAGGSRSSEKAPWKGAIALAGAASGKPLVVWITPLSTEQNCDRCVPSAIA